MESSQDIVGMAAFDEDKLQLHYSLYTGGQRYVLGFGIPTEMCHSVILNQTEICTTEVGREKGSCLPFPAASRHAADANEN